YFLNFSFSFYEARFSEDPFYFMPAIHMCHTANIIAPDIDKPLSKVEHTDDLTFMVRLLYSWNEPLFHLSRKTYQLNEFSAHFRNEIKHITRQSKKLQKVMETVTSQFDPEITKNVDYAVWTGLPSLQSTNEQTSLFAIYNLLRCLSWDLNRIDGYLKWFLCVLGGEC
uniref:Prolactin n=1 Tax=Cavia porcellus TaxID=10141 RepID=H0WD65_CAVPO